MRDEITWESKVNSTIIRRYTNYDKHARLPAAHVHTHARTQPQLANFPRFNPDTRFFFGLHFGSSSPGDAAAEESVGSPISCRSQLFLFWGDVDPTTDALLLLRLLLPPFSCCPPPHHPLPPAHFLCIFPNCHGDFVSLEISSSSSSRKRRRRLFALTGPREVDVSPG